MVYKTITIYFNLLRIGFTRNIITHIRRDNYSVRCLNYLPIIFQFMTHLFNASTEHTVHAIRKNVIRFEYLKLTLFKFREQYLVFRCSNKNRAIVCNFHFNKQEDALRWAKTQVQWLLLYFTLRWISLLRFLSSIKNLCSVAVYKALLKNSNSNSWICIE